MRLNCPAGERAYSVLRRMPRACAQYAVRVRRFAGRGQATGSEGRRHRAQAAQPSAGNVNKRFVCKISLRFWACGTRTACKDGKTQLFFESFGSLERKARRRLFCCNAGASVVQ